MVMCAYTNQFLLGSESLTLIRRNHLAVTFSKTTGMKHLRIGSCLACVHRVMDARGKFGEHERSVRVARGAAETEQL